RSCAVCGAVSFIREWPSPPPPLPHPLASSLGRGGDRTLLFRSRRVHPTGDERDVIYERAEIPSPPLPPAKREDRERGAGGEGFRKGSRPSNRQQGEAAYAWASWRWGWS